MIDVHELQLGNWLLGSQGTFQVLAVLPYKIAYKAANSYGDYLFYLKEDCHPVSITTDMLKGCGFKETKWENSVYENESGCALEYVPEEDNQPSYINYFTAANYDYMVKAHYVHQLQNLYFILNGTHLNLEL